MRLRVVLTILVIGCGFDAYACTVSFETASTTNLKPSATTHTVWLRQSAGAYTGYEMTDASPYNVVKVTPNFQTQLTVCPPPPSGDELYIAPPQASVRLSSGGYLFAQRSDLFGLPGNYFAVNVLQFDASMRLVAQSSLMLNAGPMAPGVASSLVLADLNGDGLPDLIAGVSYPHAAGIQVLLGSGGTSFQTPTLYGVSDFGVGAITTADVNSDHKLDLITAGYGNGSGGSVSVFFGNGDGTFQPQKVLLTNFARVDAVAVGDLNRDGKPDLAFTLNTGGAASIEVALGNGDGTFANPASYPAGGSQSIAIGDIDGNGIPDIVTSGITIFYGDGTGALTARRDYAQQTMGSIILTDFDGYGITDIVVGTGSADILSGTAVAVLHGQGDGSFAGGPITVVPGFATADNTGITIESTDFDGDGIPDVIMSDIQTGITVLRGNGDGTFKYTWRQDPFMNPARGLPSSITIGDFNRDGVPDFAALIAGASTSAVELFIGLGDGTFQAPLINPLPPSLSSYSTLAVADFDGDGKLDLAVTIIPNAERSSLVSTVVIYLGRGDGTFAVPFTQASAPGVLTVAAGDFNNDGVPDLALTNDGHLSQTPASVSLLFGNGDGTFKATTAIPFANVGAGAYTLAAADLNLDGNLDLVFSAQNPSSMSTVNAGFAVLLGKGDGTFQPAIFSPLNSSSLRLGDMNGDGIPDIVSGTIIGAQPGFGYILGNGDGTFQAEVELGPAIGPVVVADFNGDGQSDVAGLGVNSLGIGAFLNTTHGPTITLVSAASFTPGPAAAESLMSAFGLRFPPGFSAGPVSVHDGAGVSRAAPVLYASPQQVNFEVPAGTGPGLATVTIANRVTIPNISFSAPLLIQPVTPAVFQLNRAALAAAYVVRVSGGVQTIEPISAPIDLGPATDQVYLSLFGTGLRNASQVAVRINGIPAPVTYAGPQPGFIGLDQVNVLLPRQLAGVGQAGIVLNAAGKLANTTYVYVK